jgi:hypothetical protein
MPKRHVTLFVPGPWERAEACARAVGEVAGALTWIPNDGAFGAAFTHAQLPEPEVLAIDRAPGAAIVETDLDLQAECAALVTIGQALQRAGGLGIRVEQSQAASGLGPWVERLASGDLMARYRTLVVHAGSSGEGVLYTCGMHLFSRPDAQLAVGANPAASSQWLTVLNCFQLDEDPALSTGHTFSPDAATPRRPLERWPDHRHPASHACHNPFGLWHAGQPDAARRPASKLAIVFMPALAVVLQTSEEKAEMALDRDEVERITHQAACITMTHEDARALERKRGYADLDPELAWEQWCVLRAVTREG